MSRRRNNTAAATVTAAELAVTVIESLPMEVDEETVEEYKKLGDKLDTVMSKIKNRKERKK